MLAVPQNMGFLACALPIESYSSCHAGHDANNACNPNMAQTQKVCYQGQ
jgi:hypothetical protein